MSTLVTLHLSRLPAFPGAASPAAADASVQEVLWGAVDRYGPDAADAAAPATAQRAEARRRERRLSVLRGAAGRPSLSAPATDRIHAALGARAALLVFFRACRGGIWALSCADAVRVYHAGQSTPYSVQHNVMQTAEAAVLDLAPGVQQLTIVPAEHLWDVAFADLLMARGVPLRQRFPLGVAVGFVPPALVRAMAGEPAERLRLLAPVADLPRAVYEFALGKAGGSLERALDYLARDLDPRMLRALGGPASPSAAAQEEEPEAQQDDRWQCASCTAANPADRVRCAMCSTPRGATSPTRGARAKKLVLRAEAEPEPEPAGGTEDKRGGRLSAAERKRLKRQQQKLPKPPSRRPEPEPQPEPQPEPEPEPQPQPQPEPQQEQEDEPDLPELLLEGYPLRDARAAADPAQPGASVVWGPPPTLRGADAVVASFLACRGAHTAFFVVLSAIPAPGSLRAVVEVHGSRRCEALELRAWGPLVFFKIEASSDDVFGGAARPALVLEFAPLSVADVVEATVGKRAFVFGDAAVLPFQLAFQGFVGASAADMAASPRWTHNGASVFALRVPGAPAGAYLFCATYPAAPLARLHVLGLARVPAAAWALFDRLELLPALQTLHDLSVRVSAEAPGEQEGQQYPHYAFRPSETLVHRVVPEKRAPLCRSLLADAEELYRPRYSDLYLVGRPFGWCCFQLAPAEPDGDAYYDNGLQFAMLTVEEPPASDAQAGAGRKCEFAKRQWVS